MTVFTVKEAVAILIKGCDKHPEYRAKKSPPDGCGGCSKVWKAMEDLKTLQGGE